MNRIGRTELTGMEHLTVDETVERIARVSLDEVIDAAKAAYSGPYVLGAVGLIRRRRPPGVRAVKVGVAGGIRADGLAIEPSR